MAVYKETIRILDLMMWDIRMSCEKSTPKAKLKDQESVRTPKPATVKSQRTIRGVGRSTPPGKGKSACRGEESKKQSDNEIVE